MPNGKFKVLTLPVEQADDPAPEQDLRFVNLLRAFRHLERIPSGKRTAEAVSVAAAIGLRRSRFYELWRLYDLHGPEAIMCRRRRSDYGIARAIPDESLLILKGLAQTLAKGDVSRAWRASELPCSSRTFGRWIKRLQKAS